MAKPKTPASAVIDKSKETATVRLLGRTETEATSLRVTQATTASVFAEANNALPPYAAAAYALYERSLLVYEGQMFTDEAFTQRIFRALFPRMQDTFLKMAAYYQEANGNNDPESALIAKTDLQERRTHRTYFEQSASKPFIFEFVADDGSTIQETHYVYDALFSLFLDDEKLLRYLNSSNRKPAQLSDFLRKVDDVADSEKQVRLFFACLFNMMSGSISENSDYALHNGESVDENRVAKLIEDGTNKTCNEWQELVCDAIASYHDHSNSLLASSFGRRADNKTDSANFTFNDTVRSPYHNIPLSPSKVTRVYKGDSVEDVEKSNSSFTRKVNWNPTAPTHFDMSFLLNSGAADANAYETLLNSQYFVQMTIDPIISEVKRLTMPTVKPARLVDAARMDTLNISGAIGAGFLEASDLMPRDSNRKVAALSKFKTREESLSPESDDASLLDFPKLYPLSAYSAKVYDAIDLAAGQLKTGMSDNAKKDVSETFSYGAKALYKSLHIPIIRAAVTLIADRSARAISDNIGRKAASLVAKGKNHLEALHEVLHSASDDIKQDDVLKTRVAYNIIRSLRAASLPKKAEDSFFNTVTHYCQFLSLFGLHARRNLTGADFSIGNSVVPMAETASDRVDVPTDYYVGFVKTNYPEFPTHRFSHPDLVQTDVSGDMTRLIKNATSWSDFCAKINGSNGNPVSNILSDLTRAVSTPLKSFSFDIGDESPKHVKVVDDTSFFSYPYVFLSKLFDSRVMPDDPPKRLVRYFDAIEAIPSANGTFALKSPLSELLNDISTIPFFNVDDVRDKARVAAESTSKIFDTTTLDYAKYMSAGRLKVTFDFAQTSDTLGWIATLMYPSNGAGMQNTALDGVELEETNSAKMRAERATSSSSFLLYTLFVDIFPTVDLKSLGLQTYDFKRIASRLAKCQNKCEVPISTVRLMLPLFLHLKSAAIELYEGDDSYRKAFFSQVFTDKDSQQERLAIILKSIGKSEGVGQEALSFIRELRAKLRKLSGLIQNDADIEDLALFINALLNVKSSQNKIQKPDIDYLIGFISLMGGHFGVSYQTKVEAEAAHLMTQTPMQFDPTLRTKDGYEDVNGEPTGGYRHVSLDTLAQLYAPLAKVASTPLLGNTKTRTPIISSTTNPRFLNKVLDKRQALGFTAGEPKTNEYGLYTDIYSNLKAAPSLNRVQAGATMTYVGLLQERRSKLYSILDRPVPPNIEPSELERAQVYTELARYNFLTVEKIKDEAKFSAETERVSSALEELKNVERYILNASNAPLMIDFDLGAIVTIAPSTDTPLLKVEPLETVGRVENETIGFWLDAENRVFRKASVSAKADPMAQISTYAAAATYREFLFNKGFAENNPISPEAVVDVVMEKRELVVSAYTTPEICDEFVRTLTRLDDDEELKDWPFASKKFEKWGRVTPEASDLVFYENVSSEFFRPLYSELADSPLSDYYNDPTLPVSTSDILTELAENPYYTEYYNKVYHWAKNVVLSAMSIVSNYDMKTNITLRDGVYGWMKAVFSKEVASQTDVLTALAEAQKNEQLDEDEFSMFAKENDYLMLLNANGKPEPLMLTPLELQYARRYFVYDVFLRLQELWLLELRSSDGIMSRPFVPRLYKATPERIVTPDFPKGYSSKTEKVRGLVESLAEEEWDELSDELRKSTLCQYIVEKDGLTLDSLRVVDLGSGDFEVLLSQVDVEEVPSYEMISASASQAFSYVLPTYSRGENLLGKVASRRNPEMSKKDAGENYSLEAMRNAISVPYVNGSLMHHQASALLRHYRGDDDEVTLDMQNYHDIRVTMLHVEPGGGKTITGTVKMLMALNAPETREYFAKLYDEYSQPRNLSEEERNRLILECPFRPLVVSPDDLLRNWIADAQKITGGDATELSTLNIYPLNTAALNDRSLDIIRSEVLNAPPNTLFVSTYSAICNPSRVTSLYVGSTAIPTSANLSLFKALGFTHVFLDEAHALKNADLDAGSRRRIMLTDLMQSSNVKEVYIATGSPSTSRISDFVGLSKSVRPSMLNDYREVAVYADIQVEDGDDVRFASTKDDFKQLSAANLAKIRNLAYSVFNYNFVPQGEWAYMLPEIVHRNFLITTFADPSRGFDWVIEPDMLQGRDKSIDHSNLNDAAVREYRAKVIRKIKSISSRNANEKSYARSTGEWSYEAAVQYMFDRKYYDRFPECNIKSPDDVLYYDFLMIQMYFAYLHDTQANSYSNKKEKADDGETEVETDGKALRSIESFIPLIQFFNDPSNDTRAKEESEVTFAYGTSDKDVVNISFFAPAIVLPPPRAIYCYYMLLKHFDDYYQAKAAQAIDSTVKLPRVAGRKVLITAKYRRSLDNLFEKAPPEIRDHAQIVMGTGDIDLGGDEVMGLIHAANKREQKRRMALFENSEDVLYMFATEDLVGTGFNLQMGNRIISFDVQITPGSMQQLMSRVRRPDVQNKYGRQEVYFDRILVDGSYDVTMLTIFAAKYAALVRTNNELDNADDFKDVDVIPQLSMGIHVFRKVSTWTQACALVLDPAWYDTVKFPDVENVELNYIKVMHTAFNAEKRDGRRRLKAQNVLSAKVGSERLAEALSEKGIKMTDSNEETVKKEYHNEVAKGYLPNANKENTLWRYLLPAIDLEYFALILDNNGNPIPEDSEETHEVMGASGKKETVQVASPDYNYVSWPVVQDNGTVKYQKLAVKPRLIVKMEKTEPLNGTRPLLFTAPIEGEVNRAVERLGFDLEVLSTMLNLYQDYSPEQLVEYGWPVLTQYGFGRLISINSSRTTCTVALPNGELLRSEPTSRVSLVGNVTQENQHYLGMMVDIESFNKQMEISQRSGRVSNEPPKYVCYKQYANTTNLTFKNEYGEVVTPKTVVGKHPVEYVVDSNGGKSYQLTNAVTLFPEVGRKFNRTTNSYIEGTGIHDSLLYWFEPLMAENAGAGVIIPPFSRNEKVVGSLPETAVNGYFKLIEVVMQNNKPVTQETWWRVDKVSVFVTSTTPWNAKSTTTTITPILIAEEVDVNGNAITHEGTDDLKPYRVFQYRDMTPTANAALVDNSATSLKKKIAVELSTPQSLVTYSDVGTFDIKDDPLPIVTNLGGKFKFGEKDDLKMLGHAVLQWAALEFASNTRDSDPALTTKSGSKVESPFSNFPDIMRHFLFDLCRVLQRMTRGTKHIQFNTVAGSSSDGDTYDVLTDFDTYKTSKNSTLSFALLYEDDIPRLVMQSVASNGKVSVYYVGGTNLPSSTLSSFLSFSTILMDGKLNGMLDAIRVSMAVKPKEASPMLFMLGTGLTANNQVDLQAKYDSLGLRVSANVVSIPKVTGIVVSEELFGEEQILPAVYGSETRLTFKKRKKGEGTKANEEDSVTIRTRKGGGGGGGGGGGRSTRTNTPPTRDRVPTERTPTERTPTERTPTDRKPTPTGEQGAGKTKVSSELERLTSLSVELSPEEIAALPSSYSGKNDVGNIVEAVPNSYCDGILVPSSGAIDHYADDKNRLFDSFFIAGLGGSYPNKTRTAGFLVFGGVGSTYDVETGVANTKPLHPRIAANFVFAPNTVCTMIEKDREGNIIKSTDRMLYGDIVQVMLPTLDSLKAFFVLPITSREVDAWFAQKLAGQGYGKSRLAELDEKTYNELLYDAEFSQTGRLTFFSYRRSTVYAVQLLIQMRDLRDGKGLRPVFVVTLVIPSGRGTSYASKILAKIKPTLPSPIVSTAVQCFTSVVVVPVASLRLVFPQDSKATDYYVNKYRTKVSGFIDKIKSLRSKFAP